MLITCPCGCGHSFEVNPASLLGKRKKTMTPAALAARKANASKPRPRKTAHDGMTAKVDRREG